MDILRQKRLVQLFLFFWVFILGLIAQLWLIQIKDGYLYTCLALEQGSRWVALEDATRGKILDRNLIPLTGEKWEDRIIVFPMAVDDKLEVSLDLAEILGAEYTTIERYMEGGACYLPYNITPEQSKAIRRMGWKGVMVLPVQFRFGERTLASHTVGHLGKISSREEYLDLIGQGKKVYHYSDLVGKTGLEKYYEQDLKGSRPQRAVRVFTDARGELLGGPGFEVEDQVEDKERRDLVLTIDSRIQQIVEDVMERRVAKGAVVVMEAGSGDILALASRPGFNPAHLEQNLGAVVEESFFDRCTALYQPGSIFKIVVAAAALEEGAVDFDSRFTCYGEKENLIRCWKDGGHGDIDFLHAFTDSCNPAFARLGLNLGASKLIEYAGRLGLNNQSITGYQLPFDRRQDLDLIGAPYNLVNSSIGQGPVLVTPVQIASMINAIISDGRYREPRLVKQINKNGGSVAREFPADTGREAISPDTAGKLRRLMELAVDEGTGREAMVTVFGGSAGKTGSAQVGNEKGQVNAWFAGYAPRDNPCFVITVLVEDGRSGSESAAPVFRDITEQILRIE